MLTFKTNDEKQVITVYRFDTICYILTFVNSVAYYVYKFALKRAKTNKDLVELKQYNQGVDVL